MIDILEMTATAPDIAVADGDVIISEGERTHALFVLVGKRPALPGCDRSIWATD